MGLFTRRRGAAVAAIFDPATLSLSNWQRAYEDGSFVASPWVGVASAGASGGRDLTEATNPPSAGALVNGYVPYDLDGVNDELSSGVTPADLFTDTAYTIIMLVYVRSFAVADTGAGSPYTGPGFSDSLGNGSPVAGIVGTGAAGVFRAGHYGSPGAWDSAAVAIATGEWVMLAARYDGTNMQVSKNGGAWTSQPLGTCLALDGTMRLGRDYTSTEFLDGMALEVMTADSDLSDGNIASLLSYFRARYDLPLV